MNEFDRDNRWQAEMRDTLNKTRGRKVPIRAVESAMKVWRFDVAPVLEAAQ